MLLYEFDAETVEESDEEILVVYEAYRQALIQRGSEIEFLYCKITNPFDRQGHGWGVDTKWAHRYDSDGSDEMSQGADKGATTNPRAMTTRRRTRTNPLKTASTWIRLRSGTIS